MKSTFESGAGSNANGDDLYGSLVIKPSMIENDSAVEAAYDDDKEQ